MKKRLLWGNKATPESSSHWNDEADSFNGNKQSYQEFLRVCRTLPLPDIICSILGEMCLYLFNLPLSGGTELRKLEKELKEREKSPFSLKQ